MKRTVSLLSFLIFLQGFCLAQDFILNNPTFSSSPATFPGGKLSSSFDLYILGSDYSFSSNELSQDYATIVFQFTKLNPTNKPPTGDGADLFKWNLSSNNASGSGKVYTWTGSSKDVVIKRSPFRSKYKIVFSDIPVAMDATQAEADIKITGQFYDPTNFNINSIANNYSEIATYSVLGNCQTGVDFGDLPTNWKPASAGIISPDCDNDGIPDGKGASIWAGAGINYEVAPKSSYNADGDEYDDGLILPEGIIIPGAVNNFKIKLSSNSNVEPIAYYGLWFDWNNDGDFSNDFSGAGQGVSNFYSGSGKANFNGNELNVQVLFPKILFTVYKVRLIVSDKPINQNDFSGGILNGEVEDYQVTNSSYLLVFDSFNANAIDCNLKVDWKMISEQFLTRYEIEISRNGIDYKKVAELPANGLNNYSKLIDLLGQMNTSLLYVRIKAVDLKGFARYSEVKTVTGLCKQNGPGSITLFPNPAVNTRQVTISAKQGFFDGTYRLIILDNNGRVLQAQEMTLNNVNQFNLDLPATMSAGKYRVDIRNTTGVQFALIDFIVL